METQNKEMDYDFDMECNLGFLDDIEYENPDSCDKSVANSSNSSSDEKSPNLVKSGGKQMVMIDQNQLNELIEAKRILESQKIASASAMLSN